MSTTHTALPVESEKTQCKGYSAFYSATVGRTESLETPASASLRQTTPRGAAPPTTDIRQVQGWHVLSLPNDEQRGIFSINSRAIRVDLETSGRASA